ncbi:hypothetical protein GCM10027047_01710 [Rhodococcus aerolatus]
MAGASSGSVFLNVLPAMAGFYAQVKAKTQGNPPIQQRMKLVVDQAEVDKAKRQLQQAEDKLNRSRAASIKASDRVSDARRREADAAGRVTVAEAALAQLRSRANVDAARMAAAEERVAKAKRDSAAASLKVAAADRARAQAENDVRSKRRSVRTAEQRVSTAEQGSLQVDTTQADAKVDTWLRRLAAKHAGVDVDADTSTASLALKALTRDRTIDVQIDLHQDKVAAGLKMLGTLSGAAFGALGAQAAVGGLVAVVAAASEAAGALLLLPAAGAAGALALGGLKIGLSGVSDVFANWSDPEKYAEAVGKLSPNAQEAIGAIRALDPQIQALKASVQDELFDSMGPKLGEVGSIYLPILGNGFAGVAREAGNAVYSVLDLLTTSGRIADITTITDGSVGAFANLQNVLAPLVGAFIDIAAVGSDFLPGLTAGAGGAAQGFADMVAKARESGRLNEIIQQGIDMLRTLGQILGNVGSIIGSVFSAGQEVGGGFLNTIAAVTGEVAAFFKSADGQSALSSAFAGIGEAVRAIVPLIGQFAGIFLGQVVPVLTQLATSLAPAASAILSTLGLVFAQLTPVIQSLAPVISVVGQVLADVLLIAVQALAPVLVSLMPLLTQVAAELGGALAQAVVALAPAIGPLVEAGLGLIQALLPLVPLVAQVAAVLAQGLATAIIALLPAVSQIVAALAAALMPLLPPLVTVFQQLAPIIGQVGMIIAGAVITAINALAPLLPPLIGAVLQLLAAFLPLLPVIAQLAADMIPPLMQVLVALVPLITNVINMITPWISLMITALIPAIQQAGSIVQQVFQFIADWISARVADVQGIFNGLMGAVDAVGRAFQSAIDWIREQWGKLVAITHDPVAFVVNTVYNDGIRAAWNKVAGWLGVPELDRIEGWAVGGPVFGPGSGTSDSILARLSNNEHVVTDQEVRGAGGHAAVEAQRAAWRRGEGQLSPQYATGGPVLVQVIPAFAGGGEVTWPAMWDIAQQMAPGVVKTSDYRPGGPYHGTGQAIDLSFNGDPPAQLNALSNAIAASYPNSTELINLGGSNIKNGQDVGDGFGTYGASTMAEHGNHVHWANDQSSNFSGLFHEIGSVGRSVKAALRSLVASAFDGIIDPIGNAIPTFGDSPIGRLPRDAFTKMKDSVRGWLLGKADEKDASGPGMGPGDDVERWRPMAIAALARNGFPTTDAVVNAMLGQIHDESGGNPGIAQQIVDVNGTGDSAGVGLLQIIPTTWAANRDPSLPDDRRDPWANMNGALRYFSGRYGNTEADVLAHWGIGKGGYDQGGVAFGKGLMMKQVIQPERVLSPQQTVGYERGLPILDRALPTLERVAALTAAPSPQPSDRELVGAGAVTAIGQQFNGPTYHYDPHENARRTSDAIDDGLRAAGLG